MEEPTRDDMMNELRRLTAANERLTRLVAQQRPELRELRDVEVALRDWRDQLEWDHGKMGLLVDRVQRLLGSYDDLPSTTEVGGILGDGKARVDAALAPPPSTNAVDPSAGIRESRPRAHEDSSSLLLDSKGLPAAAPHPARTEEPND